MATTRVKRLGWRDARRQWQPTPVLLPGKIPWTEEPGRLQSMGSLGVGQDWATSLFTCMHWKGRWQPIPVFLPGESQGQGSLVGCRLWGRRVRHYWSDLAAAAAGWREAWKYSLFGADIVIFSKIRLLLCR